MPIIVLIQGCSHLGIGESDYACNEPGKSICKSARQVYQDTQTTSTAQPLSLTPPQTVKPDLTLVTPESTPHRIPAQILRIWFAPWVDKQGNWHSGGLVMTDITPRDWQNAVPIYSPSEK